MIKTGTMEERPQNRGSHKLSVMNRRTGSITGVSDVISFDISEVLLETALDAAPEGTVELCQGPGSAVSGQGAGGGAVQGWTEEDLYVLAHVICGEAQNCPDDEQRFIGSVVLNRRNSGRYPGTIKGVVFQPGQYSCTRDGNYYRTPTEANWANARWLLENGSVLPGNVVFQSGGRQGKGVYLRTGYHYYCY